MHREGVFSLCYLDDFIGVEASHEKAVEAFARFTPLSASLGLQLALDKCFPPTTSLTWLGFTIATMAMSVSIPNEKVSEVLYECARWKHKPTASRHQLQALAGKLQHLAKCIEPSARFTNRVLAALQFQASINLIPNF